MTYPIHHEGGGAANNCPADRLTTYNARADPVGHDFTLIEGEAA